MREFNLYIFTVNSRAYNYGIGTYINHLIEWIKEEKNIHLTLIKLFCEEEKEIKIEQKNGYKQIIIPSIDNSKIVCNTERYIRNCTYLLKNIIPNNENNLFHIHSTVAADSLTLWIKKLFQGKVLLTLHYIDWCFNLLGDKKRLLQILEKSEEQLIEDIEKITYKGIERDKKNLQYCDKIICIAQHSLDSTKEIFSIEDKRICLIPNGQKDEFRSLNEVQKTLLKQKYYIPESEKIILFAGRLEEAKGIGYLLQTFGKVLKRHSNIHLIIAGDGNFDQWISSINTFWTKVTFAGKLNKKQLFDLYHIADIGVVCSMHEEFGLVALEMMMHALPLIVTDVGGLKELIEDNQTGLKVPLKRINKKRAVDTVALKKQICYLLENQDVAFKLGQNARKVFIQKYEYTHFKKKMLNLYNELITS